MVRRCNIHRITVSECHLADTAVKLWKIAPKLVRKKKKSQKAGGTGLRVPHASRHPKTVVSANCRREFKNAHGTCHIDSISVNSDGATFISTDALKINLWDVEVTRECYSTLRVAVFPSRNIRFCFLQTLWTLNQRIWLIFQKSSHRPPFIPLTAICSLIGTNLASKQAALY